MKITYKGNTIEAVLIKDGKEGFDDEIRFIHPTTGSQCEMFDQVFQGWSERDPEANRAIDRMQELFRINSNDIYTFLFAEIDIDLERYEISMAAAALGRKGGSVKSDKKAASSAENGKKGGRPRKNKDV